MPKRTPGASAPPEAREAAGDVTEPQDGGEEELAAVPIEDEEIVPLSEDDEETVFQLWYGPPGSTKTTSMARILLARPEGLLIVCNAEGGMKLRALRQWGIPTDRIRVWPKPGVRPTFDALERLVLKIDAELADARRNGAPKPYCGFGMDSATELIQLMLDNVREDGIAGQREIDRRTREAGMAPPRRNQRARFKTERDDYGLVSAQVRSILRKLKYMDLDVLITALVRRDEDQDTGKVMYGPAMNPALQADMLGFADIVIRTERRETADGRGEEVVGYTRADENHHGKDRYSVLPPELLPPGADIVLGHVLGESPVVDSADKTPEADETDTEPVEPPAKKAPARTRKTAPASRGRIDTKTMTAVGEGDGSDDQPPY